MEEIFTLKEAILWKGNQAQINKFNEIGRLPSNQLKAIETYLNEEYEKVEKIGKGKNIEFVCSDKRFKPVNLDKRQDNKGNEYQTPISKPVENMLIRLLLNNSKSYQGAISNIMFHSGLAGHYISYYKAPSNVIAFNKKLLDEMIINKSPQLINHVFSREYATLENQILSALRRMERGGDISWSKKKMGVIKTFNPKLGKLTNKPIVKGYKVEGSYQDIYKELNHREEEELAKIERELKEKYNVEYFDIIYRKSSNNVKAYELELKEKFKELGFDYYFDCYFLYLKASKQKLKKKYNIDDVFLEDDYYKNAVDYTMGKANDYKNRWLEDNPGFGSRGEIPTPIELEIISGTYMDSYGEIYHHALPREHQHLLSLNEKTNESD